VTCTLWLTVHKGLQNTGTEVWSRSFPGEPLVGDVVVLFQTPGEDDPGEGPEALVKSRGWDSVGQLDVHLLDIVADPQDEASVGRYASAWSGDRDGDLEAGLRSAGWVTWADRQEPGDLKDPNAWVCPLGASDELCRLTHDHYPRRGT
jgi:hypothetical protein